MDASSRLRIGLPGIKHRQSPEELIKPARTNPEDEKRSQEGVSHQKK